MTQRTPVTSYIIWDGVSTTEVTTLVCSTGCATRRCNITVAKKSAIHAATRARSFSKLCIQVISMPSFLKVLCQDMHILCSTYAAQAVLSLGGVYAGTSSGCSTATIGSYTRTGGREGLVFFKILENTHTCFDLDPNR